MASKTYVQLHKKHLKIAKFSGKKRACGNKIRYKTYVAAQRASYAAECAGFKKMQPYNCPFCFGWHIGGDNSSTVD